MNLPRQHWLMALLCLAGSATMQASDENLWPVRTVAESADGAATRTEAFGPLFFEEDRTERRESGLRPLFLHREFTTEDRIQDYYFFPFFRRETRGASTRWSFLSLINYDLRPADANEPTEWKAFDLWPLYFSRNTGDPATSYHALLPVYGTIKRRFGNDRIDFTLFPLYSRWQKGERVETDLVWPFYREIHGGGESGWALWPLYGHREKDGGTTARSRFIVWPLWLEKDRAVEGGTDSLRASFPLFSRRRAPGLRDDMVLLWGSLHQTTPVAYDETRYLWPLWAQGHGADGRVVDRWAPFYTHSVKPGGDAKKWFLWPLLREEKWTDAELAQTKTQVLYFLYWDLEQRDRFRPAAAPARKTHLWPFFSYWDNGAGRRQVQALSPFEVFYQHDAEVRQLWSPLFALYRLDRASKDAVRTSFLFNLVTYRRDAATWKFDLGPLCRVARDGERTRFSLLPALFSRREKSSATAPAPAAAQP
jgi:hypothetical protein